MTFELGDYQATELLATGASAQVWCGHRTSTGQPVALKVFPPDQLAAVRREAALAAAVDHPHLVRVLDVVADERRAALVTEHAAGGDLADLLARRGRLTPGQTLTVLIPLAAALATAHERQVVHGDISAGNIVFDEAGRPLLADLGAARAAMESGRPVQATPCDAAPELARAGAPTPATDLFSLGSVALACLTGRAAWPADDLRDVLIQAAAGQWPDLPDDAAPAPLVAAVRSLLEHDPERRPGAASLVLDLRSVGRPEPLGISVGRRGDRSPGPAAGTAPESAPDRPTRRRHARDDDEPAGADQPGLSPWSDRDAAHRGTGALRGQPDPPVPPARALTRARADAPGPDARTGADSGRRRSELLRSRVAAAVRPRSGGALRITVLVVAGVVVAGAAGLVGLRWADSSQPSPVAVQQLPAVPASVGAAGQLRTGESRATATGAGRPPTGSPSGPPTRRSTPAPASPSAATRPSPTSRGTAATRSTAVTTRAVAASSPLATPTGVPVAGPADWTATVRALDQARSRALVGRDPALLDAVYTPDSTARSADALTIRTLVAQGLRVSGAQHRVQSVQPVTGAAATVLVRDSLPSYDVLSATGAVVGRTPARGASPRVMVLVNTAAGYRISEVRVP